MVRVIADVRPNFPPLVQDENSVRHKTPPSLLLGDAKRERGAHSRRVKELAAAVRAARSAGRRKK
jgi:hypothetical protein